MSRKIESYNQPTDNPVNQNECISYRVLQTEITSDTISTPKHKSGNEPNSRNKHSINPDNRKNNQSNDSQVTPKTHKHTKDSNSVNGAHPMSVRVIDTDEWLRPCHS